MMKHLLLGFIIALSLVACAPQSPDSVVNEEISWDRNPETIVFRADVIGGEQADAFFTRNEIPLCTIYGDNRVVWVNDLGDFNRQVLWDKVSDEAIRNFILYLAMTERFFTFESSFETELPTEVSPVREILQVAVSGRSHSNDSFSGWDDDPLLANASAESYFQRVVKACKSISTTPVLYEPQGAWLSAQVIEYSPNIPMVFWESAAANLPLAPVAAADNAQWLDNQNVRILWSLFLSSSQHVAFIDLQDNEVYQLALQVPGITRESPPAP